MLKYFLPECLFCLARKIIIRIEDAIPTEKHPQATFRNPKTSAVSQASNPRITIQFICGEAVK
jgi:hypothetical protein